VGIVKTRKGVDASSAVASIRQVFLSPRNFYTPGEAAEILGWTLATMEWAIEDREVEVELGGSSDRIAWQELVTILMARCPQAAIEEALGPPMTSVIPEPVRLAELRIRIPQYQVAMLTKLAERERISVDDLMARHLLDVASSEAEWLGHRIPGFEAAMRWPGE
jgi:hypothetical protein